ncbi:GPI-linked NAD(P)(+)--arginine ADP-ribosyltransferase 1 [Collichthys lucidus]|uniref:NAD(P)(+)--arginine ADP-ribosyltransferase n=1 Tax=Collichthys lucidus TaxID=240159 RepID=A0A4U5VRG2_COLLU|nr:GPI-linked NAD(P)(+)--arginine ADP-ribosyltransferase 1 [Collichthys lucidus]
MEEDSVDDMYFGCTDDMVDISNTYLKKEKKDMMWDEKVIKDCIKRTVKENKSKALTEDQLRALCAYTAAVLHVAFNKAVRAERTNYGSTFKYHSLHYLLTSAIQVLNPHHAICNTVYRRTNYIYTGKVNQIIRLGYFGSTSLVTTLTGFGANSCFKIQTCSGADVHRYAQVPEQQEVLIPPYEQFKITEIHDGQGTFAELTDCRRVFVLESVGGRSSLNCKLVTTETEKQFPVPASFKLSVDARVHSFLQHAGSSPWRRLVCLHGDGWFVSMETAGLSPVFLLQQMDSRPLDGRRV